MIYEVRARLFFTEQDEARDFFHDAEVAFPKAQTLNPGQVDTEYSLVEFIENHHDENPHAPCNCVELLQSES